MPELSAKEEAEARLALAEKYPPEDGPYRIVDENGHEVTVSVVKPGQKFVGGPEVAFDENGRWKAPITAEPKAKPAAKKES